MDFELKLFRHTLLIYIFFKDILPLQLVIFSSLSLEKTRSPWQVSSLVAWLALFTGLCGCVQHTVCWIDISPILLLVLHILGQDNDNNITQETLCFSKIQLEIFGDTEKALKLHKSILLHSKWIKWLV